MPQFVNDFLYGAKIASEYVGLVVAAFLIIGSCFGLAIAMVHLAMYLAGDIPALYFIIFPIELIIVGGFGTAFFKLSQRKWSEFCQRKKQRVQKRQRKQWYQRLSKNIEQR